ncbi:MAG: hypothetical protein M3404_01090 [Actinomycetota bacterium]|nr:hypothetical protein [Actinomycetota bacterium]
MWRPAPTIEALSSMGLPRTARFVRQLSPSSLQRTLPGQAGSQVFFSASGRAFCLYVVLGGYDNAQRLISLVNTVLGTIRILPSRVPRR